MRRPLVVLALAILLVGGFTGGLAWLLNDPNPPAAASHGERLYYAYCVECHGVGGHGSWRSLLFLLRPVDLKTARGETDRYLFDLIKHGGSPLGRPGMPAFGAQLSDADIQALVAYVRQLGTATGAGPTSAAAASAGATSTAAHR
jgi:mono/diheme cytochrome c family protein